MANFDTAPATIQSTAQATSLLGSIRGLYSQGKAMQALLALYQAGSDPKYNAAINNIYTAAERSEMAAMQAAVNDLIDDWELNHRSALGLAPL